MERQKGYRTDVTSMAQNGSDGGRNDPRRGFTPGGHLAGISLSHRPNRRPTSTLHALGPDSCSGHVFNTAGHGVAGAKVELYAWPSNWPGKHPLHPGERVPRAQVGQAFSTTTGPVHHPISHPAALKTSALHDEPSTSR